MDKYRKFYDHMFKRLDDELMRLIEYALAAGVNAHHVHQQLQLRVNKSLGDMWATLWDDPDAMARSGLAEEVVEAAKLLLGAGVNLDDRIAVETELICDLSAPQPFSRFVDAVINAARRQRERVA